MPGPIAPSWLPAAPFRSYANHLIDSTGVTWPALAAVADVPAAALKTLLYGHGGKLRPSCHREAAAGLVAVTPDRLRALRERQVDAAATGPRLAALIRLGLTHDEVAWLVDTDSATVRRLASGFQSSCAALTDAAARAVCAWLGVRPAPVGGTRAACA